MQKYNLKAKINLEKYQDNLKEQIVNISEENLSEPSMNIWGLTMDSLKWNMDDSQEYIREMFEMMPGILGNGVGFDEFRAIKIKDEWKKLNDLVIDNLSRLGIIEVSDGWFGMGDVNKEIAEMREKLNIGECEIPNNIRVIKKSNSLKVTKFGENFIDVCL